MLFFFGLFLFESVSLEFLNETSQCDSTKNALLGPEFVQRVGQWTFLLFPFPCNLVHKVLTSALITQVYLLH